MDKINIEITGYNKTNHQDYSLKFSGSKLISKIIFNNDHEITGPSETISQFILDLKCESVKKTCEKIYEFNPVLKYKKFGFKGHEFMIFKAFCLIFSKILYINILLKEDIKNKNVDVNNLDDESWVDQTDKDKQPLIYFIKKEYLSEEDKLKKIYNTQNLYRLQITSNGLDFLNYFVPFNIPVTREDEFEDAYDLWSQIKKDKEASIKKKF